MIQEKRTRLNIQEYFTSIVFKMVFVEACWVLDICVFPEALSNNFLNFIITSI